MKNPFDAYLSELAKTRTAIEGAGAHDLEHHRRPALNVLLEVLLPGVKAVNEPGRVEFGAPIDARGKSSGTCLEKRTDQCHPQSVHR